MIYFSDFGLGLAPPGAAVMGIAAFASGTATTNLDVTDSASLAGSTPSGAFVVASYHEVASDPSETANAGLGLSSSTNNGVATFYHATRSPDNVATTVDLRIQNTANVYRLLNLSGNSFLKAWGVSSHIANGIRFTRAGGNGGNDLRGHVALFDDSVGSYSVQVNLGTGTSAITVTPGFQADVVILYGTGTIGASFQAGTGVGIGIATRSGDQRSVFLCEPDGSGTGAPLEAISTSKSFMDINTATGALTYDLNVGNFTATTFDITPSSNAGSDIVQVLALNFPAGFKLMDLTTPTATGDMTISGIGFTPTAAIAILTNLEATDPSFSISTSDLMSSLSVCMFNANAAVSTCIRMDSGPTDTNTASNCQLLALMGGNATATDAIKATLVGFGSDICVLNFSAVQGTAKKGFILFME